MFQPQQGGLPPGPGAGGPGFPPGLQPPSNQSGSGPNHRNHHSPRGGNGGRRFNASAAVTIRNPNDVAAAGAGADQQAHAAREAEASSSPSRKGMRRGGRDGHRSHHRHQNNHAHSQGNGSSSQGDGSMGESLGNLRELGANSTNGGTSTMSTSPAPSSASLPGAAKLGSGLSAKAASAAVFVPKSSGPGSEVSSITAGTNALSLSNAARAAVFNPSTTQALGADSGRATPDSFGNEVDVFDPTYTGPLPPDDPGQGQAEVAYNPYEATNEYGEPTGAGGMDLYSQQQAAVAARAAKIRQPLQYHQYAPPLPHVSNLHPHHLTSHAFFLHPSQREELQRKQEAIFANIPPPELGGPNLPEELHVYHSLVPLEPIPPAGPGQPGFPLNPALLDPTLDPAAIGTSATGGPGIIGSSGDPSKLFGYRSHCYKAVCSLDGKAYVLRRLEGFKLQHEVAIGLVERWRRIRHPSIVSVREAFTTRGFGDQSIVFVYDYHPLASTLHAEHMVPKPPQPDRRTGRLQMVQMQVPEKTLWSYTCQLANALRCIHKAGLAARSIEPSKVLHTGQNRVRINCCSIFDVIAYDARAAANIIQTQQADDLLNLGKLLLCTACNSAAAASNVTRSLEQIARVYSPELKSMIMWLLQKPHAKKDADELVRLLAGRMADEFDSALNYNDSLSSALMRELENARLVRLLCKLGFINERPEFDHDPRWSETGDRYVVKLFRDHVFHAVNEAGRPLVDLSHILTNLNKLDAGSEEKLMLTSRDEQSCIIASYREIKNCIESAFQDLSRR